LFKGQKIFNILGKKIIWIKIHKKEADKNFGILRKITIKIYLPFKESLKNLEKVLG
jgi:hypothetical protein